ncbi:MAG: GAF domain-containing protein [Armatimonadia bacterium]|nr:GAF domain-containing protein [Armatimonadia bacterium]
MSWSVQQGEPSPLGAVVRKVRRLLGCDGAAILLSDGSSPKVFPCAASDGTVGPFQEGRIVPASLTPIISGRDGWTILDDHMGRNCLLDLQWTSQLRSSLWLPMCDERGVFIGALAVFDTRVHRFSGDEAPLLEDVAVHIQDMVALYARLVDPSAGEGGGLGVHPAGYGLWRLAQEIERSARYGNVISVAIVQVHGFAEVGGGASENSLAMLRTHLGEALALSVREVDTVAALGPDRFLIVAPETDAAGALAVAARLSGRLTGLVRGWDQAGVAAGTATSAGGRTTPEALVESALACVYRARWRRD